MFRTHEEEFRGDHERQTCVISGFVEKNEEIPELLPITRSNERWSFK